MSQYCEGYYEPTAIPNETVSRNEITRNFTYCSPRSANFQFDPREALQRDLNASGNGWLNVSDLNWPDDIDRGIDAIHIVQRVAFIICACKTRLGPPVTVPFSALGTPPPRDINHRATLSTRLLTEQPQTASRSG